MGFESMYAERSLPEIVAHSTLTEQLQTAIEGTILLLGLYLYHLPDRSLPHDHAYVQFKPLRSSENTGFTLGLWKAARLTSMPNIKATYHDSMSFKRGDRCMTTNPACLVCETHIKVS